MAEARDALRLHRIEASTLVHNTASQQPYQVILHDEPQAPPRRITEAGEITEAGRLPGHPSCLRDFSCVRDVRTDRVRADRARP